jgi:hydrogenase nickel incorporation protein HypA/HybF
MHETDMTKALILTLKDWREAQPDQPKISCVHLIVGKFTCVEPVSLQFAFEVQCRNTFLEGAKLEMSKCARGRLERMMARVICPSVCMPTE